MPLTVSIKRMGRLLGCCSLSALGSSLGGLVPFRPPFRDWHPRASLYIPMKSTRSSGQASARTGIAYVQAQRADHREKVKAQTPILLGSECYRTTVWGALLRPVPEASPTARVISQVAGNRKPETGRAVCLGPARGGADGRRLGVGHQLGHVPPTLNGSPRRSARESEGRLPTRSEPPRRSRVVSFGTGAACLEARPPARHQHSPGSGARPLLLPPGAADSSEKPFQMAGAALRWLNVLTIWPRLLTPDCKTGAFKRIARVAKKKKKKSRM